MAEQDNIRVIRAATASMSVSQFLKGQLHYLNTYFDVSAIAGDTTFIEEIERRENVAVQYISIQRPISIFRDIVSLIKLIIYFRNEKPTIVHSLTPKAGLLCMIAGYVTRVPLRMHTFTGLLFPTKRGLMRHILIAMDTLTCTCATHIYPEGEGVKIDMMLANVTKKPLRVLGHGNINGVNLGHFTPESASQVAERRRELDFGPDDTVFLFIGRLNSNKGINELIAAFRKLATENDNVHLLLAGDFEHKLDPLLPHTLSQIKEHDRIMHLGYRDDVKSLLSVADCLVLPSYREGFPNVVLEAGAMAKPSIVTDINGANEIIRNDHNGWIIPPKDERALYKLLENFLTCDSKQVIGQNALHHVTEYFSNEAIWHEVLKEYNAALDTIKNS